MKDIYKQYQETDEDPYEFFMYILTENIKDKDCVWGEVRERAIKLFEEVLYYNPDVIEEYSIMDSLISGTLMAGLVAERLQQEYNKELEDN